MKFFDVLDEFREWEKTHNKDNYGRFDAFTAGYKIGIVESAEDNKRLREAVLWAKNQCGYASPWWIKMAEALGENLPEIAEDALKEEE